MKREMLKRLERDEVLSAPEGLAAAYLNDYARVSAFYAGETRDVDALAKRASELLSTKAFTAMPRRELVRTLTPYMRALGAPKAALAAAAALGEADSFAVVVGQQPGIAGGPALLLYKVAHAVSLAKRLREAGVKAVAVFWAASEDHDIDEVNAFRVLERGKDVARIRAFRIDRYPPGGSTPLERLALPGADSPEADAIAAMLPDGAYRQEALAMLRLSLSGGFGQGLNRLLLKLFGERGLIVLEPRLLRKFSTYQTHLALELEHPADVRRELEYAERELLAKGFSSGLAPSPYGNVFFIERGKRKHLLPLGTSWSMDGHAAPLSIRELLDALERRPALFSCGVRLRPIVQGACLPVLASIVGPAEIAYHAGIGRLFEWHEVPMPLLIPRWSFLLADSGFASGLPHEDPAPKDIAAARRAIAAAATNGLAAAAAVSECMSETHGTLENLGHELRVLRRPLQQTIERLGGGIDKALRELRGRILADPLAHSGAPPETREAAAWIAPGDDPQERVISWLALWPRWARALSAAFDKRDPFDFDLHVLEGKEEAPDGP